MYNANVFYVYSQSTRFFLTPHDVAGDKLAVIVCVLVWVLVFNSCIATDDQQKVQEEEANKLDGQDKLGRLGQATQARASWAG